MKTCEIHTNKFDAVGSESYPVCGKPAKFIAPDPFGKGKEKYVCGIHRGSIDKMLERIGSDKKCEEIQPAA